MIVIDDDQTRLMMMHMDRYHMVIVDRGNSQDMILMMMTMVMMMDTHMMTGIDQSSMVMMMRMDSYCNWMMHAADMMDMMHREIVVDMVGMAIVAAAAVQQTQLVPAAADDMAVTDHAVVTMVLLSGHDASRWRWHQPMMHHCPCYYAMPSWIG